MEPSVKQNIFLQKGIVEFFFLILQKGMVSVLDIWFNMGTSNCLFCTLSQELCKNFLPDIRYQKRHGLFLNPDIDFPYGKGQSWDGSCFHFCFHC